MAGLSVQVNTLFVLSSAVWLTLLVAESPFLVVTEICQAFSMWMKTFRHEKKLIFEFFLWPLMNFAIAAAAARGDWLVGASEII